MCVGYIRVLRLMECDWVPRSNELVLHLKQNLLLIEEPLLCCVMLGVMVKGKRQEDEMPKSMLETSIKFCQELR